MYAPQDLMWKEYELPSGELVIAKRCECRTGIAQTVVVVVHRSSECVDMYPYHRDSVRDVIRQKPRMTFRESEITPREMYTYLGQDDTERVIAEIYRERFSDVYPASRYMDDILGKWKKVRYPDWTYSTMGFRSFALLKDFDAFDDGHMHTVEITDRGVAVYHANIPDGCTLNSNDRIVFIDTEVLSPNKLAELCCVSHAMEIAGVSRALRRWLFHAVLTKSC